MTEPEPLGELAAAAAAAPTSTLVGELAGAVARKDVAAAVVLAIEVGRRVERGEIAEQDVHQPPGQRRPRRLDT